MIEKAEYLKAKQIVAEYEEQLNIHNVINMVCDCCNQEYHNSRIYNICDDCKQSMP